MKMHTDRLTSADIRAAEREANRQGDFFLEGIAHVGSRSRQHGYTFRGYSVGGRYATNTGTRGGGGNLRAASWHDWGVFIAELFKRDPDAIIGFYDGADGFRRYILSLTPMNRRGQSIDFLDRLDG